MATPAELEAKIKLLMDWAALRAFWAAIKNADTPEWRDGEALEYLVLLAFELDNSHVCLVESKDWGRNVPFGPIAKMRSQLLRRPAGTIGIMFVKEAFTQPAIWLAHFTLPQAILLWPGDELQSALEAGRICDFLRMKHRVRVENGMPDYDIREGAIP